MTCIILLFFLYLKWIIRQFSVETAGMGRIASPREGRRGGGRDGGRGEREGRGRMGERGKGGRRERDGGGMGVISHGLLLLVSACVKFPHV